MYYSFIILGITILVTLLAWRNAKIQYSFMMRPYAVLHERKWYQTLTSGFVHADWSHLAFNMITFFFFGQTLEMTIGTPHLVVLYFSALFVSSIPSLLIHGKNPNYATLGASGGVEAIIFSFILFYPFEKLYLFFIPIGIPAILFGILFLGYSIFESRTRMGKINHDAHIAGAAWGISYTLLFVPHSLEHFLTMIGWI